MLVGWVMEAHYVIVCQSLCVCFLLKFIHARIKTIKGIIKTAPEIMI